MSVTDELLDQLKLPCSPQLSLHFLRNTLHKPSSVFFSAEVFMQITRELSTSPNFPAPRLLDELQNPPALLATRSVRSSSTARVFNVKKTEAARQPALVRLAFFCSALNT